MQPRTHRDGHVSVRDRRLRRDGAADRRDTAADALDELGHDEAGDLLGSARLDPSRPRTLLGFARAAIMQAIPIRRTTRPPTGLHQHRRTSTTDGPMTHL